MSAVVIFKQNRNDEIEVNHATVAGLSLLRVGDSIQDRENGELLIIKGLHKTASSRVEMWLGYPEGENGKDKCKALQKG